MVAGHKPESSSFLEDGPRIIMELIDRYRGCLLGLATGDALGVPLEFKAPGTFEPITGMLGGGSRNLKPGERTE